MGKSFVGNNKYIVQSYSKYLISQVECLHCLKVLEKVYIH